MSEEDENNYKNSEICWICNTVRDHCYITGKFRSPAHKECNSKLRISRKIPIIFHNLEVYDGQIIFKEQHNFNNTDIQVIPKSSEKYMTIVVNRNIVLDSLQFLKLH